MNKKGWYLVLILGFLLVTIQLGKWIGLQSQMDFIDLALGLMTGIGLIVAASIKIKRERQIFIDKCILINIMNMN